MFYIPQIINYITIISFIESVGEFFYSLSSNNQFCVTNSVIPTIVDLKLYQKERSRKSLTFETLEMENVSHFGSINDFD